MVLVRACGTTWVLKGIARTGTARIIHGYNPRIERGLRSAYLDLRIAARIIQGGHSRTGRGYQSAYFDPRIFTRIILRSEGQNLQILAWRHSEVVVIKFWRVAPRGPGYSVFAVCFARFRSRIDGGSGQSSYYRWSLLDMNLTWTVEGWSASASIFFSRLFVSRAIDETVSACEISERTFLNEKIALFFFELVLSTTLSKRSCQLNVRAIVSWNALFLKPPKNFSWINESYRILVKERVVTLNDPIRCIVIIMAYLKKKKKKTGCHFHITCFDCLHKLLYHVRNTVKKKKSYAHTVRKYQYIYLPPDRKMTQYLLCFWYIHICQ